MNGRFLPICHLYYRAHLIKVLVPMLDFEYQAKSFTSLVAHGAGAYLRFL